MPKVLSFGFDGLFPLIYLQLTIVFVHVRTSEYVFFIVISVDKVEAIFMFTVLLLFASFMLDFIQIENLCLFYFTGVFFCHLQLIILYICWLKVSCFTEVMQLLLQTCNALSPAGVHI